MYRARPGSRGMGAAPTAQGISDCASFVNAGTYWRSPSCWMYSPSAWVQMQQFSANAPSPLLTPPAAPSTIGQETVPGVWTPDQAITQTEITQQQAATDQMAAVPYVPPGGGSTGLSLADWIGNLFGGSSSGVGVPAVSGLSTTAMIAIGLAAGIGLLVLTSHPGGRRRR